MNKTLQSTIGAGALVVEENKVLLVQLNYGKFIGSWILPGGLLKPQEEPSTAVLRELTEETNQVGVIIKPHAVRFRLSPVMDVYWVFHVKVKEHRPIQYCEGELMDVRFWSIDEAMQAKSVRPMTKYFIQTFLNPTEDFCFPGSYQETDTVIFL